MYVCIARAEEPRPITAAAKMKIASAVEQLFADGHNYDSMQFHFISAIMAKSQKLDLSRTRQAREVLQINKMTYYKFLHWVEKGRS